MSSGGRRPGPALRLLRGGVAGLSGAAIVLGAAVAAVWPLWYLATRHTALYTFLVLGAGAAWLALSALSRRRGLRRSSPDAASGSGGTAPGPGGGEGSGT